MLFTEILNYALQANSANHLQNKQSVDLKSLVLIIILSLIIFFPLAQT